MTKMYGNMSVDEVKDSIDELKRQVAARKNAHLDTSKMLTSFPTEAIIAVWDEMHEMKNRSFFYDIGRYTADVNDLNSIAESVPKKFKEEFFRGVEDQKMISKDCASCAKYQNTHSISGLRGRIYFYSSKNESEKNA